MPRKKTGTEALLALASRARGGGETLLRASSPYWARIAGLILGIWGSWYGMAAGFLIGYMVDAAREGRLFRARFKGPGPMGFNTQRELAGRDGLRPGLAAAGGIALAADWPCAAETATRMGLFLGLARDGLGLGEAEFRRLGRFLEAARLEGELPLPALFHELAASEAGDCRRTLSAYAYALQGKAGQGLDHEAEFRLRRILADSGCGVEEIARARRGAFPGYRDPWELLGLEAGAGEKEIRRAWKRQGARLHPDVMASRGGGASCAAAQDEAGEFRAVREAYEFLAGLSR
jgi:hypothetical protein